MTTKTSEVSVSSSKILWVDDEIDLLKSNIMFLRQKGFDVSEVNNGEDAIALILTENFDLVFMDEMMPGMGGLEALVKIKEIKPNLPVVMVTKNETETLMEEAIGQKISDYLIKPVNPTQVLLVCKKILESKRIKGNTVSRDYILEFNKISALLYENPTWSEWIDIYNKLTNREIEIDTHPELGLKQMLTDQKKECNVEFSKFIENEYVKWVNGFDDKPTLSHEIMEKYVFPELPDYDSVFFFVVDCMRLDQWLMMEKFLHPYFDIKKDYYYSLLPTATPYSRNAIFAGLYPSDIEKHYSDLWKADDDLENSKNNFEKEFLQKLIDRKRIKLRNELRYTKIMDSDFSRGIESKILSFSGSHLNAIVINFLDMMVHSRSDYAILKEIAPDEAAFRSLTASWFEHSSFFGMLRQLSAKPNIKVIITTDHGSIRCLHGVKVFGDRDTATNLRYKYGRNVKAEPRNAIFVKKPLDYKLPVRNNMVSYIIAKEDFYFVYPTDFHKYLNQYNDTFQHGGISLEEMILPIVSLESKAR
ncbi:MAG: bifunctional response regulator/alkaline phosphatase family protein [Ignavibacteriaceae bacterium]|jgi:DNA-binding response OmpR family regulator|nr:MAG: response regulator [Chlorobiota bacterium]KXK04859.1 MAG: response regulator receiver protein [Chlorobi bacterium OLB4]MBV6397676.1 Regulator of RpoS [Ignavibacteria bacterium]MCC6885456.1 response regulator [Ignavibacteriales bacterium]MCE7952808.1 response regulator [Chlorobi bacterium CHB7]MDL1887025.1 bifunctional response regulator/alkaline phosphatase family protein [Ignavibacteria bacterium CHB1]MEB2328797.1 bifunctional response regulator/alkaline phosphatase family protein [I